MKLFRGVIIPLDSDIQKMPSVDENLGWWNREPMLNLWVFSINRVLNPRKSISTTSVMIEKWTKFLAESSELFEIAIYNVFVMGFVSYETAATPIVSLFPTTACWLLRTVPSLFAGRTTVIPISQKP